MEVMRGIQELVFSVTNRCTADCQDCPIVHEGAASSTLTFDEMAEVIRETHSWGNLCLVVFTGGEPLLLGDELFRAIRYASGLGVATRIVSNGYWAASQAAALDVVQDLIDSGLSEINISCDDYHQEFVPIDRIRFANDAANELGLPNLLVHRDKEGGTITHEYLQEFLGVELSVFEQGKQNPKNNVISLGPNVPIKSREEDTCSESMPKELAGPCVGPCKSVMKSIIVSANRRIQICCGIASNSIPELFIGRLGEAPLLRILANGNSDLVTNWLALEGPSGILDFVQKKAPDLEIRGDFVNRCDLCNELLSRDDVRQVIADHGQERAEVLGMLRGALDWVSDDWATTA